MAFRGPRRADATYWILATPLIREPLENRYGVVVVVVDVYQAVIYYPVILIIILLFTATEGFVPRQCRKDELGAGDVAVAVRNSTGTGPGRRRGRQLGDRPALR